jgi:Toprim domain
MNALKDLLIYCQNNDLDPFVEMTRWANPTISVEGARPLTWEEVEALTGGGTGTFARPCPYCGPEKRNSKRFQIQRPQFNRATWHCFYCDAEGAASTDAPIDAAVACERERAQKAERTAAALRLWEEAVPITGTPVMDYLRARSIASLPPNVDDVLRYHPACPFGREGRRRCMLALFRDVHTDEPRAIQRTWISSSPRALGRMSLGPIRGAAIKLWPLAGSQLVIGEGIETVLAAALHLRRHDGEALQPAWAATVAANIKYFPLIEAVSHLSILVDNDKTGVGQRAAEACSCRWCDAGREVLKLIPQDPHKDFNDIVMRGVIR